MALAPAAYTLWQHFLRYDPDDPSWPDRDRFILSNGHASTLLYALLHLLGVKVKVSGTSDPNAVEPAITLDQLKRLRRLNSRCPGHPEYGVTPGVEATTGPLGQGIAISVGVAIAQKWLAAYFNRPGFDLFRHRVYAICGDGCLMEGLSSEAASLAGHLQLSNLCWIYDSNQITLDGSTSLTLSEDVPGRFRAAGWRVRTIADANDLQALVRAFKLVQTPSTRPTLLIVRSHIAYGAPNKQDTSAAHGEPLGAEESRATKRNYGWPEDTPFLVPVNVLAHFTKIAGTRGRSLRAAWDAMMIGYERAYPVLASQLKSILRRDLPVDWDKDLPVFAASASGMSTRAASGIVLNAIAKQVPWFLGGSADLAKAAMTRLTFDGADDFSGANPAGRNLHFGCREHAMVAVLNGLSLSGIRSFGSTFLAFLDYCRPALRLSALMRLPVVVLFSHDSITVSEDGPTHQPIEQLATLRAMPNLITLRPADANEVVEAWRLIAQLRDRPAALLLSRQALPTIDRSTCGPASGLLRGGYVLAQDPEQSPLVLLLASGSAVAICLRVFEQLLNEGIPSRVVSMPSWELFEEQSDAYRESVIPSHIRARVSVEEGCPLGWHRYVGPVGRIISTDHFGMSGSVPDVTAEFGFTQENVASVARALVQSLSDFQPDGVSR
jgi:transketolase